MNQIVETEYRVVQERTLEVIATEIRTIDDHVCKVAVNGAVEIGQKLKEAKDLMGHGNWEQWCKDYLNYSQDWAANLMRLSEEYGRKDSPYLEAISNTDTCRYLSISKALRLLKLPEEEVKDFVETQGIENTTVKQLEEKIKEYQNDVVARKKAEKKLKEQLEKAVKEKEAIQSKLEDSEQQEPSVETEETLEASSVAMELKNKEILSLKKELEKARTKTEKAKIEEKKREEERQKEILEIKRLAETEAMEQAQEKITAAEKEVEAEKERARGVEAKAQSIANPHMIGLSIAIQDMQKKYQESLACIENLEEKEKQKAQGAVKQILSKMLEEL